MKKYVIWIMLTVFICTLIPAAAMARQNRDVYQAQEKLRSMGYQPGTADGVMGKKTAKALKKFQKDKGLQPTGKLDNKTLNLIFVLTGGSLQAAEPVAASVSHALQTAQQLLISLGFAPGPADGIMGTKTRAAIRDFQRQHGLSVTGNLNDTTIQKIKTVSGKNSTKSHTQNGKSYSRKNEYKKAGTSQPDHRGYDMDEDNRETPRYHQQRR